MQSLWFYILSTDIQKKIGARNRISIDFDATETTKEIPAENEFNPPRASTPTRDIEQRLDVQFICSVEFGDSERLDSKLLVVNQFAKLLHKSTVE